MAHEHVVIDNNRHFTIDPLTRVINAPGAIKLIQGDHNSELLTFEVPRFVDGHDMSLCTKVEVHFINISADKKAQSPGVYPVDDVQLDADTESTLTFSWLISGNATKHAGVLSFLIRFECSTGETIDYAWHTALYSDITVGEGMDNGEEVIAEYSDVLEAWKAEIVADIRQEVGDIDAALDAIIALQESLVGGGTE